MKHIFSYLLVIHLSFFVILGLVIYGLDFPKELPYLLSNLPIWLILLDIGLGILLFWLAWMEETRWNTMVDRRQRSRDGGNNIEHQGGQMKHIFSYLLGLHILLYFGMMGLYLYSLHFPIKIPELLYNPPLWLILGYIVVGILLSYGVWAEETR